jgi:CBS domain-containing protein
MRTRDYYRTEVVTAPLDASAAELAERMGDFAVGCVVIVDDGGRPVGIVTDRDLTCRVVARSGAPDKVRAAEIMSHPLVTAGSEESIEQVVDRMRTAGVRRVVVLREGRLSGLVSVDDLVVELGRELDDIGESTRRAVESGRRRGQRERRRADMEETLTELRTSVERAGRDVADFLSREFDSLRARVWRSSGSSEDEAAKGAGREGPKGRS